MSTLVLHGKVLRSVAEPLNVAFLLSVAFNELADAGRFEKVPLCAKVSILDQRLNCAAACGRMEGPLTRLEGREGRLLLMVTRSGLLWKGSG